MNASKDYFESVEFLQVDEQISRPRDKENASTDKNKMQSTT